MNPSNLSALPAMWRTPETPPLHRDATRQAVRDGARGDCADQLELALSRAAAVVYRCPSCPTSMEVDVTAKPAHRGGVYCRAVDQGRVVAHLGTAAPGDSEAVAQRKLDELIDWHVRVALDPAVNGGFKLMPAASEALLAAPAADAAGHGEAASVASVEIPGSWIARVKQLERALDNIYHMDEAAGGNVSPQEALHLAQREAYLAHSAAVELRKLIAAHKGVHCDACEGVGHTATLAIRGGK